MTEFNAIIEKDEEGRYAAKALEISRRHTQGKNIPQVLERIREAIEVFLEYKNSIKPIKLIKRRL